MVTANGRKMKTRCVCGQGHKDNPQCHKNAHVQYESSNIY